MLSDAPLAGPPAPESTRHDRQLRPAVIASLLLHSALALALGRGALTLPQAARPDTDAPAVSVRLVTRSPQDPEPVAAPEEPVSETVAPPLVDAPEEALTGTAAPPAAEAPAEIAPPDSTEPAIAESAADSAAPSAEAVSGVDGEQELVFDVKRLQDSIGNAMVTYRRDVLDASVRDCQRYRERYDRWDCPRGNEVDTATRERIAENLDATFRVYTYGHDRNARISEALLADMATLRPLMEDAGILGTLARQRYSLKAEQYTYLNPWAYTDLTAPMRIGGPDMGGVIALVSFGSSGIVILNGLLTIGIDGKVSAQDKGPARPFDEDEECALPPSRQGQRAGGCW